MAEKKLLNETELEKVTGGTWYISSEWYKAYFEEHRGKHITKYECGDYIGSTIFARKDSDGKFCIAELLDSYEKDTIFGCTKRMHFILPEDGDFTEICGDDYTIYLYIE